MGRGRMGISGQGVAGPGGVLAWEGGWNSDLCSADFAFFQGEKVQRVALKVY